MIKFVIYKRLLWKPKRKDSLGSWREDWIDEEPEWMERNHAVVAAIHTTGEAGRVIQEKAMQVKMKRNGWLQKNSTPFSLERVIFLKSESDVVAL